MGCITPWNQNLSKYGGGIQASRLRVTTETKRMTKLFAIKLAIQTRIEMFGEEKAFEYLMLCIEKGFVLLIDAEEIFEECF